MSLFLHLSSMAGAHLPDLIDIEVRQHAVKQATWSVDKPLPVTPTAQNATDCSAIDWASWSNFNGFAASGTIQNGTKSIGVTIASNYPFNSTPGIAGYPVFADYPAPIPNRTVPRMVWTRAAGTAGTTTMCFSEKVSNPILLLGSLGNAYVTATLKFSVPYVVLYSVGNMLYSSSNTLSGTEGCALIMFPGEFTCLTI